jgi:hypothetical protein
VAKALTEGLVSRHVSADGTLVRANASYKSFVPLEVAMAPDEYKRRLRVEDRAEPRGPQDPGNRAVNFRGETRSNATHRSLTDPDCRYVSKGTSGTGAYPGYTVTALMENRHRILLGLEPDDRGIAVVPPGTHYFGLASSVSISSWNLANGRAPRMAATAVILSLLGSVMPRKKDGVPRTPARAPSARA